VRAEDAGEFLETAWVHGARYGTPRDPVESSLGAGKTVVLEIDVQGAMAVRAAMPAAVLVFIEPPTPEVLRVRLQGRATEEAEVVERRLRNAASEMSAASEFDFRIVNDDLEDAIERLIRILEAT